MRGKLLAIDGNDGSGKHTQAEMLRTALIQRGLGVFLVSFPRYEDSFFGRELRRALDGDFGDFSTLHPHLASLLYAADRWVAKPVMLREMEHGAYVICDRYMSANQIHQGGKIPNKKEREKFLAWLDQMEFGEYKIPRPDISIYLDVPPSVSKKLMSDKTRDIVENNPKYLEDSHRSAQWLIQRDPERWLHVKCTRRGLMRSREEIHTEIMEGLKARSVI